LLRGAAATPAVLIQHAAAEPPAVDPIIPEPRSSLPDPAVRRERERFDAWIRDHLSVYPPARWAEWEAAARPALGLAG
jgi:hypothetical protein